MRILVVDDEREIVDLLSIYLRKEGHQVIKAYDGTMALKKLVEYPEIKLMILDIMMPKKDGLSVVKEAREQNIDIPILLLSAKGDNMDKIKGLRLGADDYVVKPFHPLEIMARVNALLKRYRTIQHDHEDLEIGTLTIKKAEHKVLTSSNESVALTALEFGILYLLASNPNKVFSVDDIFEQVWQQDSVVSAKTVMVHVSHLRDKLEKATGGEKIVETVWGVGYKISKV
ncbi:MULTISPECIES: response regulator transcription factor [unclassified Granulicatella]|uniref:response regulator transcription factor n=1 Tax=unclassified Granulicatella TaxID=2630493 RepID=UPI001073A0B7|nr:MULTISPECIES: response regulator transcription factor [unclassified Granulicatella]MBF0780423.1 response regulator transcription factor [Granulicatella sp. 19428wC4_WM01]TFU95412.1 response regulator transcription factor [Granulicatella sp. WM01]